MTSDHISHWIDLLESTRGSDLLPDPSLDALLTFLYSELSRQPQAIKQRDEILRANLFSVDGRSTWQRAGIIATQARRLHSGMRSNYGWITRADRIKPLPETQRRIFGILTR